jgi:pyruvate/2-oxoglutarate dehydrogenase complex dihydrolipoamide dehydrogenase (E3) component
MAASSQPIKEYDAIVLGSGQGGTPLSSALAAAGYKTLLVEKSHLGGTCVNEGCTPTKTMVASARVAYLARRAGDYGVNAKVEGVDMTKVRQRKRDIVDSFRGGSERRTKGVENLDVLMGAGSFVGEKEVMIQFDEERERYEVAKAKKWVFISVGERPAVPKLEGLETVIKAVPERVLNSTTVMELGEVPESLIVLGGGYVGLEFAQLFARLGAKVHVVQRAKQVLPREDPEVVEVLQDLLREEGLQLHLNTQAVAISREGGSTPLTLKMKSTQGDGSTKDIQGSHILLAAGRVPNTDTLNLDTIGVETNKRGYITTNASLETSTRGIYAMGDCKGPPAFTHVSYDDFRILRDNLNLNPKNASSSSLDKPPTPHTTEVRKSITPYCCFTDPQLAHVGLHLSEIPISERKNIQTASWPMSWVARGLETDETRGILKAVVNKETGAILGFTALAPEGGEMMTVVQVAMMGGLKWWDLREAVFAHPAWAEALNNVWGALKDAPME